MAKKPTEGYSVGGMEKWSYALYFFGQNIIYVLVASNVQTLFSDVGITAATIAGIIFVTKLWDAINDPLFGIIVDKFQFKKGRFLPWLRISLPFIAVASVAMMALPANGSITLKIVWAIIGYVAWDMSYTMCDVPVFVLPISMTDSVKERTEILSLGRYIGVLGYALGLILLPALQSRIGWLGVGIAFTICGALFMIPACFKIKERYIVRPEEAVTFKQMARYIAGNKYMLFFYLAFFISSASSFSSALSLFFARYNLGDQDLASIIGAVTMLPLVVVGAIVPSIIKRVDKFYLFVGVLIAATTMGVIRYFVGYDILVVYIILTALQNILIGVYGILMFMFTPDCIEYGTYHTGERAEGIASAVQSFFNKLTGSISGPIAMLIIGAFGFVTGEVAVQPASALNGIWTCMTLFPCIGTVLALIFLSFYKLREKDVQVMAEYNRGKITKDEAEALLAKRYGKAANLTKMVVDHD